MSRMIGFHRALVAVFTVGAFGLMGVSPSALAQTQTIKVDGSSTVFPITEAVAEEFQKSKKGVRVTVGISGTGGGFKKFCRGEIDIADASRPDQQERNGRLSESRYHVSGNANRLRRSFGCSQPEEHVA